MRKIFDQNRVAPVRLKRRRTWQLILSFVLLVALLFTLSFIISYNMLRGDTVSNSVRLAELEQIITEKDEIIDELRQQVLGNVPTQPPAPQGTTRPEVSATAKPQTTTKPVASATTKPATTKPAATAKPTEAPPPPTEAPRSTEEPSE